MNIEVLFFGQLRELTEERLISIDIENNASLDDLIEHLCRLYGNMFREKVESIPQLRILINGREYTRLDGLETIINEGDTIAFLPTIAGG